MQAFTRYKLTQIGNAVTVTQDSTAVASVTALSGAAREPSAPTRLGVRSSGGSLVNYFSGLFPDLRINNAYYPLSTKEQTTQLAQPDGLGAELITQSVLENPAVKGSQWTYLGNGRWQYVGDGTLNELIPIFPASQPNQGYLEFEIESITGSITCSQNSLARTVFNSVGVKRYFYTDRNEGGTNGASVSFKRALGTVASCIIKNISFKPLGTANPLTLFNTVPEQWEVIPCNLRRKPTPDLTLVTSDGFSILTSDGQLVQVSS